MSSSGKRKGGRAVQETSDDEVVVTAASEMSAGDITSMDDAPRVKVKRLKHGSPKARRAVSGVVIVDGADSAEVDGAPSRMAGRPGKTVSLAGAQEVIADMKAITGGLMDVVFGEGVGGVVGRAVMEHAAKYEQLLMGLLAENERLRGRLEAGGGVSTPVADGLGAAAATRAATAVQASGAQSVPVVLPKPVETWSVVVKGKGKATSQEVVQKVVKEVGPTLGVRVHDVRPIRAGGAVIRTPSVAERQKIAANSKFAEVGLEVQVREKLGPRIVVRGVYAEIAPAEFMSELYELNLKESMTPDTFKRSVRMVSSPWTAEDNKRLNVVLECTPRVLEQLVSTGAYIRWFRFQVREQDVIRACYRCLSYDHRVGECRMRQEVCMRCGVAGHRAADCTGTIRCRDCQFKGLPAGHRMLSMACPVYGAMVARVNSRH